MSTKFKKGVSGNPNGKPKGAINKDTRDIKEVISHLVSSLKDGKLDEMLDTLFIDKPEAVLNFIAKIAPKDITIDGNMNNTEIKLNKKEMIKAYKEVIKEDNV